MFIKIHGSSVHGVDAIPITVEVNWTAQGKEYCIVGLPDAAVKESIRRVESALKANKFEMPRTRIVINLAPADIKKVAPHSICQLPLEYSLHQNNFIVQRCSMNSSSWVN